MTPSIAALLGRWFWWPQIVRQRPASAMLRPVGPRSLVRAFLLNERTDPVVNDDEDDDFDDDPITLEFAKPSV